MKKFFRKKNVGAMLAITLVSFVYYGVVAPKEYTSKSVFLIKSLSDSQQSVPGFDLFSAVQSNPVTPVVMSFISTPELFEDLDKENDYHEHLKALSGVEGVLRDIDSVDGYWSMAERYIKLETSESADILMLNTTAFSPEMAKDINISSLESIKGIVERINQEKILAKTSNARYLVESSDLSLANSMSELAAFRASINSASPSIDQGVHRKNIASLEGELMEVNTLLATKTEFLSARSPQIKALKNKASVLGKVISRERKRSVGMMDNLSYESLLFEVEMQKQGYQISLATYEQLRQDTLKDSVTVIEISAPTISLKHTYPNLFYNTANTALIFSALLFLFSLVTGQAGNKRKENAKL